MPRKLRFEQEGAVYHVLNRGNYRAEGGAGWGRVLTFDKLDRRAPLADEVMAHLRQGYGGHSRRPRPRSQSAGDMCEFLTISLG